ncbi:hypothetical protein BK131_16060 [Paenibacillus amylolyticus]|uniref:DUF4435 domain-containing protein n=1 Tax=Paenibacillus amylolyticus TaxID=1451 RepID=A0A1R1BUB2_PAEAM|nr:DUF4435 domain-containing protein [Paenibacillus amylolyticus]OMF13419.1 hypothetical protein BK131_16060 [Paenibacillus amylolyticus]
MKFNIDEIIISAIMAKAPVILVEGYDDIQFYEKLCIDIQKDIEVYAVEIFEGYGEGCDSVIKALEMQQENINNDSRILDNFLGIIDRDCRHYRQEIPYELKGLFVLNHYSFESHFVNENAIQYILPQVTSVNLKLINSDVIQYLMEKFISIQPQLYYITLEAIKNACEQGYESVLGFSKEEKKIADNNSRNYLYRRVIEKKEDLDSFASQNNINFDNINSIVKGKWLLHTFANSVLESLRTLPQACLEGKIKKCQFCSIGRHEKCLWKLKEKYTKYTYQQIAQMFLNYYDENQLSYIKARLSLLGKSNSIDPIQESRKIS